MHLQWGQLTENIHRCCQHGPPVRLVQGQVVKKQPHDDTAADCYAMRCDEGGQLLVSTAGGWQLCPSGKYVDLKGKGYLQVRCMRQEELSGIVRAAGELPRFFSSALLVGPGRDHWDHAQTILLSAKSCRARHTALGRAGV